MSHQREVRLGLVLYGGVSLAIYENGIVQEIYRAICGDGVYELLSELIDSDIVVDVISGTSAGGVNGVMLGYALANKLDFLPAAGLWRELGDIQKLLRQPDDPDDSSLLNSVYYQTELKGCYEKTLAKKPDAPYLSELDLFVTSTDANGVISTVYDDLGHAIDVKNHRALFQLQYRGLRKNDFSLGTPEEMATLSRLTSAFPAAFKPVRLGSATQDANFYRWGRLSGPAVYMDGGILNNKPFTSTIQAIASRTATREVERFLIYVEPNPEKFEIPDGPPESPQLVQAAMRSLTSIPSYQSIAGDLESIEAHNERALQVQQIIDSLEMPREAGIDCLARATVLPRQDDACDVTAYVTSRLLMIKNAAVEAILNNPDGMRDFFPSKQVAEQECKRKGIETNDLQDDRRSGRLLVQSFWYWKDDASKTLDDYDVFFRKRRTDRLTSVLMKATKQNADASYVPTVAWEAVNHYFKLYEIAEWAMKKWLTTWVSGWKGLSEKYPDLDTMDAALREEALTEISADMWGRAKKWLDRLMTCDVPIPAFDDGVAKSWGEVRAEFYSYLSRWIDENGKIDDAPPGGAVNFLQRLDEGLKAAIVWLGALPAASRINDLLVAEFCRFVDVDRQLLPVQIGSGFESTNVIHVVRFSPLDAQRGMSFGSVDDKVRGTALANFGAFFKKSWRANDIMMGRFDAVCLLTECLLTKERLAVVRDRLRAKPITAALVARALPEADAVALTKQIADYFDTAQPTTKMWNDLVDAIVLATQKQIAKQEWPNVVQGSLEQQYEWGQYKKEDGLPDALMFPRDWTAGKVSPDQLLVQVAANVIAQGNIPAYNPATNRAKDFLEEVPLTALQEHASLALMRIGKSLTASIDNQKVRSKVEENRVFKLGMVWIPNFVYWLNHTRRTQPDWTVTALVILINVTFLAIAVLGWVLVWKGKLSWTYGLMAMVPLIALLFGEWLLSSKLANRPSKN